MSSNKLDALDSIRSIGNAGYLDIEDHEVKLDSVASARIGLENVGRELTDQQKFLILNRLGLEGLLSLDDLPLTASFMIEKTQKLSISEALTIIQDSHKKLEADVNIPVEEYNLYENLLNSTPNSLSYSSQSGIDEKLEKLKFGNVEVKEAHSFSSDSESQGVYNPYKLVDWELQVRLEAALIAYHSPYQEVRSVTDPYDDPSVPVETIRVYVLGLIWTAITAFVNEFFGDRLPGISLSTSVVQMLLYPCGKAWEYIIPNWKVKVWKYEVALNPGPWTFKEQILTGLMFTMGGGGNYVSSNITAQKLNIFYRNDWVNFGYQVLLVLSTNCMGLGFAGVLRRFVIYPTEAVWPTILPALALNRALLDTEKKERINGWTITRYKFFILVTTASFLYFWIPNYLFQALSYFNWMTWIKPDNFNLAVITGAQLGLGLNPISSFDWNVFGTGALVNPVYTTLNLYLGSIVSFFIIVGIYYSNYKWTAYLPINANQLFTNTGDYYRVREVLDERSLFNQDKYDAYGPPFYSAGNLMNYGAFFALYPFAIIHEIALTYKPVWTALKGLVKSIRHWKASTYEDFTDPHSTMMKKYKEVPDWCYYILLLVSLLFSILSVKLYPANTPVWGIFFALGINFVFLIPLTTLQATTGFSFALNVLVELIVGYALPGNGLALMTIKALGTELDAQALGFISDQKLGHYSKLPPRAMFRIQVLGTIVGSFVSMAALIFKLDHFEDYCQPHQKDKFSCPGTNTFFAASVIWGVIGPKKVFNGLYPILRWCFLIGFLLSIPCVVIKLYGPKRYVKFFQPSIIIGGMISWAPGNLFYLTGGVYLSIASMWYLKTRFASFWSKYNYVFSSAMEAGIAFSSIIIFFAVQYHPKNVTWWGNTVPFAGIDGGNGQQARLNASLLPDGYFGPRVGNFP
ncbi:OPT-domain-containing protein [Suhomyces tanzawaensis NRRL Y-17324]|uniref:OPT-domain-containing protein n=1 Tax=Suhomyces tanzawaensis NRRL Y-17324 TaxID=984487 RepID=A0A1E4SK99_9ASCO|nr:OPT-domain-containing protein [Suhomyces tanzawaensis NRRL Y-17324]ODV79852.1 OPT-domain-containing protein [Suhomyces tanzawaensis NRRL Y-17324]